MRRSVTRHETRARVRGQPCPDHVGGILRGAASKAGREQMPHRPGHSVCGDGRRGPDPPDQEEGFGGVGVPRRGGRTRGIGSGLLQAGSEGRDRCSTSSRPSPLRSIRSAASSGPISTGTRGRCWPSSFWFGNGPGGSARKPMKRRIAASSRWRIPGPVPRVRGDGGVISGASADRSFSSDPGCAYLEDVGTGTGGRHARASAPEAYESPVGGATGETPVPLWGTVLRRGHRRDACATLGDGASEGPQARRLCHFGGWCFAGAAGETPVPLWGMVLRRGHRRDACATLGDGASEGPQARRLCHFGGWCFGGGHRRDACATLGDGASEGPQARRLCHFGGWCFGRATGETPVPLWGMVVQQAVILWRRRSIRSL